MVMKIIFLSVLNNQLSILSYFVKYSLCVY